jgi:putative addiction module component (TIGR02574 family)
MSHRIDHHLRKRYSYRMSAQQLTSEAIALPLAERVSLAQALWQSIGDGKAESDEATAIREAIRRDGEISSGEVAVRSHEEVMRDARRGLLRTSRF